jgi:hypothetical protein
MEQIVTWCLVVFGWVVVHCLTVKRERQKEVRDLKSLLIEKIERIEQQATEFHTSDTHDFQRAQQLIGDISRVGKQLTGLQLKCLEVAPKYIRQFRQSITSKNLDKTSFEKQTPDSPVVRDIFTASTQLIDAIESAYTSKYFAQNW